MKSSFLAILCLLIVNLISAQVAINTDASAAHASAMLDIKSNNKGFLPPRMSWTQIQAIPNPAKGLLVFDDGLGALRLYDGNKWVVIGPRIYEITDPPGDFKMEAAKGPGTAASLEALISANKTVYVAGQYWGTVTISNVTLPTSVSVADLFVAAYDTLANLIWVKTISNSNGAIINAMKVDQAGNILMAGNFSGTIDLDPGPGTDNHTASSTTQDAFFAKYDNNLNLIWGRHLGGVGNERATSIVSDLIGNVYVTGMFELTVDFNPGPGVAPLTSAGDRDVFVARFDINGILIWSNRLGNANLDQSLDIELLSGTILIGGHFSGTVDFDFSAGVFNLVSSAGSQDIFHACYDIAGAFIWAKRIGGTLIETFTDLVADDAGNFWSLGIFEGTCDMDPDAGVVNLVASGVDNTYFAKYTSTGTLTTSKGIGSSIVGESPSKIMLDANGNVYICGTYAGTGEQVEFDPNDLVVNRSSVGGSQDCYIVKYTSEGFFLWVSDMGGASIDECSSFSVSPDGKLIFITGTSFSQFYFGFNGERIVNSARFFLARYEE